MVGVRQDEYLPDVSSLSGAIPVPHLPTRVSPVCRVSWIPFIHAYDSWPTRAGQREQQQCKYSSRAFLYLVSSFGNSIHSYLPFEHPLLTDSALTMLLRALTLLTWNYLIETGFANLRIRDCCRLTARCKAFVRK